MMNISKFIILLLGILLVPVSSCGNKKEKKVDVKAFITGRYVNNTVLSQIADTIPAGTPAYCLEMVFTQPDSVLINTGLDEATLAYKKEGELYVILKASNQGDMKFILNPDSSITLVDSAWTEIPNSSFKKVADVEGQKWAFEKYVNEAMVVGEYTLYNGTQAAKDKVIFTADGKVTGLLDYYSYSICYAGDCVGETIPLSNTIGFETDQRAYHDYAFKVDKKNKTLQLFELEPAKQDVKGDRKILSLVFDLRQ